MKALLISGRRWMQEKIVKLLSNSVLVSGVLSFLILLWVYNHGWAPFDDGVFAYVADRINEGVVFGVGVYDNHGGYQHFFNAWLFRMFGSDIVVLHYPMIVMGVIQSMIAAYLCRNRGWLLSILSGYTVTIFSYVMFKSVAPNWYALFIAFLVVWLLDRFETSFIRNSTLGFLVGICLMIRHPSAIFIGLGILAYFIYELNTAKKDKLILSRSTLILISVSLLAYLFISFEITAFFVFGIWAFFIIAYLWHERFGNDQELFKSITASFLGFLLAIFPIFLYQYYYGSISTWFTSSFMSGPVVLDSSLSLVRYWHYGQTLFMDGVLRDFDPAKLLHLGQYLLLVTIPVSVWIVSLHLMQKRVKIPPILFILAFYGYVSIYVQLIVYFYFTLPLLAVAFFQIVPLGKSHRKTIASIIFLVVSTYGLFLAHSSPLNIFHENFVKSDIPKLNMYVTKEQEMSYKRLLSVIEKYTVESEPILAFPNAPEIYYLSSRENLFPFYLGMFYVNSEEEYINLESVVFNESPKLIVWSFGSILPQREIDFFEHLISSDKYVFLESVGQYRTYVLKSLVVKDIAGKCLWYGS